MNDHGADDRSVAMVAPLRLRLLYSHGSAKAGVLPIPAGGAGMAGALELGGERLSEAQWRAANLCRIAPQGQGWQLSNASPTLVCAVNGERVLTQWPIALSAGDTLELGLLRFEVETGTDAAARSRFSTPGGAATLSEPNGARAMNLSDEVSEPFSGDLFDLRDLAAPSRHAPEGHALQSSHLDDPFGVLDIVGAERRPVGDPLAELLGELPPRPATSAASYAEPLPAPAHDAEAALQAAIAGLTETSLKAGSMDGTGPRPRAAHPTTGHDHASPDTRLFNALNEEFERVVRDPAQLTGRTDWDAPAAPGGEQSPTLDDFQREAGTYALMRDILLPREGIDQIIADFDPLGRSTLLDETDNEDVLGLFAPQLARGAKAAVPSLTRREHHDMSPDSHMELGAFRPDDNISS